MHTHSRKLWPLFLAEAVLALVALLLLDGRLADLILIGVYFGVLATAIYGLAGEKVNDGACGIGGGTSF